jgi:hypothetical protein
MILITLMTRLLFDASMQRPTRLDPAQTDVLRVGMQGWAEALREEAVKAGVLQGLVLAREALVRVIRRGQKTGVFRKEVNATAVAHVLIAIFQGFVLQATWEPEKDLGPCFKVVREFVEQSAGRC